MFDWNSKSESLFRKANSPIPSDGPSTADTFDLATDRTASTIPELVPNSAFRAARLRAIRESIIRGEFETEERIRGTVDRLIAEIEVTG